MILFILKENYIPSRMFDEEISYVVDFSLDHDPAVIIVDVFSELFPGYS